MRTDRYEDFEWSPADELPCEKTWAIISNDRMMPAQSLNLIQRMANAKGRFGPICKEQKRVLFSGKYWMTREEFTAWRPVPAQEEPVSALIEKLPGKKPRPINELSLLDLELEASEEIVSLAELARRELHVEVVRLFKPGDAAQGAVSGKILATSKSYVAQSLGGNGVVIHEQAKLSRTVQPGEQVTIDYQAGKATVFNGAYYDVNIRSAFLTPEQIGMVRMSMLEALGSVEGADRDDVMIKEALRYALDQASSVFTALKSSLPKAGIQLSVTDVMPAAQIEVAERTGQAVQAVEDVLDREWALLPYEKYGK